MFVLLFLRSAFAYACSEVEGTRIVNIDVQEAIITLSANGLEVQRTVTQISIAESRIPGTTPLKCRRLLRSAHHHPRGDRWRS